MAKSELKNVFLSASIPIPGRDQKFVDTADIVAIRDAVIALATVVLPLHRIVWGGHPSITPLIYYVMDKLKVNIQEHVTLYQSQFFEHIFPEDNNKFENVIITKKLGDIHASIQEMRRRMLSENKFSAAIFLGGMEGIETEFMMFREMHPDALLLPIASTGAASKIIYDKLLPDMYKNERLEKDYGYMSLFKTLLMEKI
ncbi:hypothetical protein HB364_30245 [Pseudoflavitalea sp. X16]|uniref:SLOG domain-containing protein n=1 Tax=Paraflavitalea devenefica TaxID=2716334 RepID=UPI00141D7865|nr:hypothetical protein [Paraflavitalea devenefica]NII29400.1 hypothetical protein [Paraflavitalea devenefica]